MTGMDEVVVLDDNRSMYGITGDPSTATHVVDPPQDLSEVQTLSGLLGSGTSPARIMGPDGTHVVLPQAVQMVLQDVIHMMESGSSISIERIDRRLTTQEAADFLGLSRSTLIRILEDGELPYEQLGASRHRRFLLRDVVAFRQRKLVERRDRLNAMTRQAYEDGLYDVDQDTYRAALNDARNP